MKVMKLPDGEIMDVDNALAERLFGQGEAIPVLDDTEDADAPAHAGGNTADSGARKTAEDNAADAEETAMDGEPEQATISENGAEAKPEASRRSARKR